MTTALPEAWGAIWTPGPAASSCAVAPVDRLAQLARAAARGDDLGPVGWAALESGPGAVQMDVALPSIATPNETLLRQVSEHAQHGGTGTSVWSIGPHAASWLIISDEVEMPD